MIINPIKCEKCKGELQPENLGVKLSEKGELVRFCLFCGDEIIIKGLEKEKWINI